MSDAAGIALTLQQVTDIITKAKSRGANPMLIGMQIFSTLGDNVTVSGDTLRLALTTSAIPITGSLVPLVDAIQSVSKAGVHLTVAINQVIQTSLNDTRIRFKEEVSFDVKEGSGAPALNNIVGVAAHKLLSWINILNIQLTQNQGRWSVEVGTSLETITVNLN